MSIYKRQKWNSIAALRSETLGFTLLPMGQLYNVFPEDEQVIEQDIETAPAPKDRQPSWLSRQWRFARRSWKRAFSA